MSAASPPGGHRPVTPIDYSTMKGIADEPHWNDFVPKSGGKLVAPLIKRKGVRNADFMFSNARVIAELKILETEFAHTDRMRKRIDALASKYPGVSADDETKPLRRELINMLRKPLQRIVNSANRQIKETKKELSLSTWRGVLICVNDGFRKVPPAVARGLLGHILSGTSYTNTDAVIYITNHFVELPDNPYANLLWAPMYAKTAGDDLVEFVNDLGRKWRAYCEANGAMDASWEQEYADLSQASVVTGLRRRTWYPPDDSNF
jgi:hypothetical protein